MSYKKDLQIILVDEKNYFFNKVERFIKDLPFIIKTFSMHTKAASYIHENYSEVQLIIFCVYQNKDFETITKIFKESELTNTIPILGVLEDLYILQKQELIDEINNCVDDVITYPIYDKELVLRINKLVTQEICFSALKIKLERASKIRNIMEKKLMDTMFLYNNIKDEFQTDRDTFQTKEEFFYSFVHDIKSPLNNVTLGIDLFLSEENQLDDKDRILLSDINEGVARINEMIENFLNNIKDEKGLETFQFEWIDPVPILEILLRDYYAKANKKGIMITLELDEEIKSVFWDNSKVFRVISNILDNAIKYSSAQSEIHIQFKQNQTESVYIVEDQGRGIGSEELKNLFDFFYQTEHHNQGFGIGLAFCKRVVDEHKGEILVESEIGKGTKVKVILPNNLNESK